MLYSIATIIARLERFLYLRKHSDRETFDAATLAELTPLVSWLHEWTFNAGFDAAIQLLARELDPETKVDLSSPGYRAERAATYRKAMEDLT